VTVDGRDPDSDRDRDRRILETILKEIRQGSAPPRLAQFRDDFLSLLAKCGTPQYDADFWGFIREHPEIKREAMLTTVRRAIGFIQSEVSKYRAIRAQRPFTEEEDRYGKETLLPLLESLGSLLSREGEERGQKGEATGK
jgi:hypothetical protein